MIRQAVFCVAYALILAANGFAAPKSLVIALDGLRGDGIENATTPNLDRLIDGSFGGGGYRGAYAYYAQTVLDADPWSGPNHSSIMTGVTAAKHGVTDNFNVARGNFAAYPHYLQLLEDSDDRLNTACLFYWSEDRHITSGADYIKQDGDPFNVDRVVNILRGSHQDPAGDAGTSWEPGTEPDAIFLFLDHIDAAGHFSRFAPDSFTYINEIEATDSLLGEILNALESRPAFAEEDWQIVITSDHGGRDFTHGIRAADNYTIPFLVTSQSAEQGLLKGTPHNYDVPPTVLSHMGVPIPDYMDGFARGGEATVPAPSRLQEGLVAYLQFEGDLLDSSGQGNHGTPGGTGPTLHSTGGKFGGFVEIQPDGLRSPPEYVSLGNPQDLRLGQSDDFTIAMWIRGDSFGRGLPLVVSNKAMGTSTPGFAIGTGEFFQGGFALHLAGDNGGQTMEQNADVIQKFWSGWWFLAATIDRDGNAFLYGGDPFGNLQIISTEISSIGDLSSMLPLNIGQDGTGVYGDRLTADIDDFAIWSRALSIEELKILYGEGSGLELAQIVSIVPEPSTIGTVAMAFILVFVGLRVCRAKPKSS